VKPKVKYFDIIGDINHELYVKYNSELDMNLEYNHDPISLPFVNYFINSDRKLNETELRGILESVVKSFKKRKIDVDIELINTEMIKIKPNL
jgi:hypothetical protein